MGVATGAAVGVGTDAADGVATGAAVVDATATSLEVGDTPWTCVASALAETSGLGAEAVAVAGATTAALGDLLADEFVV